MVKSMSSWFYEIQFMFLHANCCPWRLQDLTNNDGQKTSFMFFWSPLKQPLTIVVFGLTLSQTTNFRLLQTKSVCRQQFQIWWKWQKVLQMSRKQCGKGRNCSSRASSPFPTVFSKDMYCRHVKTRVCWGKGWNDNNPLRFTIDWLIVWCFSAVFNISGIPRRPVHLSMFSWSSFNKHSAQYSFQATGYPYNHCRNNGKLWEGNESCRNDYHQSSERILAKQGIEPATYCSKVQYAIDWATVLGRFSFAR